MDLLAMGRRVWSESGRSGAGPTTSTSATDNALRVFNAVRSAWAELQAEPRNWRWMRRSISGAPLTAGLMSYAGTAIGASDVDTWWHETMDYKPLVRTAANPANEWPLSWLPYEKLRSLFLVSSHQAASPQYWSSAPDGSLLVGPAPDSSQSYLLRIDYRSLPTELSGDDSEPNMPARFHLLLVWKALQQIAIQDGSQENLVRANENADAVFDALLASQAEPIEWGYRPLA